MATNNALNNVEIDKTIVTAKGDLIAGSGAGTEVAVTVGTDGKLLKADSGAAGGVSWTDAVGDTDEKAKVSANDTTAGYLNGKLVAGTGVSLTEVADGSNETLSVATIGGGLTWSRVSVATSAAANSGYICTHAATRVVVTLPSAAACTIGTVLRITGTGQAGWSLVQNASQQIFFGTADTTAGVTGSLASTAREDSVELVCITADGFLWNVLSAIGNITYA